MLYMRASWSSNGSGLPGKRKKTGNERLFLKATILQVVAGLDRQDTNFSKGGYKMAQNHPRGMLNAFMGGLKEVSKTNGEQSRAFMSLLGACYKPGALDTKIKELMSVAIAAYNRCEYCIVFHVYKALEAGASREEIMEAAMVAVAFGGGPSMAYSVTLLKDSLEEFAPDFNR